MCWAPRNRPEYIEIGHNGIRTKFKGKGFVLYDRKEKLKLSFGYGKKRGKCIVKVVYFCGMD